MVNLKTCVIFLALAAAPFVEAQSLPPIRQTNGSYSITKYVSIKGADGQWQQKEELVCEGRVPVEVFDCGTSFSCLYHPTLIQCISSLGKKTVGLNLNLQVLYYSPVKERVRENLMSLSIVDKTHVWFYSQDSMQSKSELVSSLHYFGPYMVGDICELDSDLCNEDGFEEFYVHGEIGE